MAIENESETREVRSLSEWDSKMLLKEFGIPVVDEMLVSEVSKAREAASAIGYPVVLKACGEGLSHKTEKGVVKLNLQDEAALDKAFAELSEFHHGEFLVQKYVPGGFRELMLGAVRDPQFGPCVSFGLGGVMAEVLNDVVFRVAPLSRVEALEMMDQIRAVKILGEFRGQASVDRNAVADSIVSLSKLMVEREEIVEVDVNPLLVEPNGTPLAVDALVVERTG